MRVSCVILATLLFPITNFGTVSFSLDAQTLRTADGSPMPTTGLVILAVSTLDSIFTAPTPDQFFSGDDRELGRWDLSDTGGGGGFGPGTFTTFAGPFTLSGNWTAGDPLQLYWFPTLTLTPSSDSPGAGTSYGTYRNDNILDESAPWVTPADGTQLYALKFLTQDAGGSNPNAAGNASLTVVPEPSHYAMVCGLVCLGYAVASRKLRRETNRKR